VSKLAAIATEGKVYGIDHSAESVAMAIRTNKQWIDIARVEVRKASVSRLRFSDGAFDVITAVETHFWWPALPTDMREVLRVLEPGGRLMMIAEVYKGAEAFTSKAAERYSEITGMVLFSSIANSLWMPVTRTFRSLPNQAKDGFAASGARPQFRKAWPQLIIAPEVRQAYRS
jgi:ubiquinone/menaquinone biosynthesis C-methylase UbiE